MALGLCPTPSPTLPLFPPPHARASCLAHGLANVVVEEHLGVPLGPPIQSSLPAKPLDTEHWYTSLPDLDSHRLSPI